MPSQTPPPYLRATISDRERSQIEHALGPIADDTVLRAVRDGRGRQFQRLEFLGDSVLDLVLTVHHWVEPGCQRCAAGTGVPEASDRALARAAERAGLGTWLEWRASPERIADLVETCVAACWLTARWPRAVQFIDALVHPIGESTLAALTHGHPGASGRAARRVGAAVLELAAGWQVFSLLPDADEGALSTARAALHRAPSVAARVRTMGELNGRPVVRGDDDTVLSSVEDAIADTLGGNGADAALAFATTCLDTDSH